MKLVKTAEEVRETVREWKNQGLSVGFVPTMGYLHEGHQSLIKRAAENDKVVVSIFVNPIQFCPGEDFSSYPRDLDRDVKKCEESGADLIFAPDAEEMYMKDFSTFVDMTGPTEDLCGKTRPGHFRGVCTVVCKLFNIVAPHRAYFGEKDAQQLAVIRRMTRDLSMDIEIIGCPIVREKDGLAKSSRNTYLSEEERHAALVINKALSYGKNLISGGERNPETIVSAISSMLETETMARIDYVKIVDADTVSPVSVIDGKILTAAAVYIGRTRLIDNFIMDVK